MSDEPLETTTPAARPAAATRSMAVASPHAVKTSSARTTAPARWSGNGADCGLGLVQVGWFIVRLLR